MHPTRRHVVRSLVSGSLLFPAILSDLLTAEARGAVAPGTYTPGAPAGPLAPKAPHFPGKAKRVIFLYMSGGVSHLETFDPKPKLAKDAGKLFKGRKLLAPQFKFVRGGKCGTEVSELFPHLAKCADDMAVVRSIQGDHSDHAQATMGVHTGSVSVARPSLGSWVSFGLGTVNQNLPGFVVLAPQLPYGGALAWSSDFLPACHQGTRVLPGKEPIADLKRRSPTDDVQEMELGLLERFHARHGKGRGADPRLAARVKSFETAFGMQKAMPEVLDLAKETDATLKLYGLDRGSTKGFAWQCLVARRLVERGVRFVELIDSGTTDNWDAHGDMNNHVPRAKNVDRAMAGLLTDLKGRGLLKDTLVVWTTEFGRTPTTDGPKGRSHHGPAFSSWLAGGGVKGGIAHGKTDDYGFAVAEDLVHVHDFHATLLHLLGFDHTKLTFRHAGRDFRLTDVHGKVVKALLA